MAIIACPSCNTRNRVAPVSHGVPRCSRCKAHLRWIVDADSDTFMLVVIRDGNEIDRVVGALPRAALEQRLQPVLAA